jgi:hypothetical protein
MDGEPEEGKMKKPPNLIGGFSGNLNFSAFFRTEKDLNWFHWTLLLS